MQAAVKECVSVPNAYLVNRSWGFFLPQSATNSLLQNLLQNLLELWNCDFTPDFPVGLGVRELRGAVIPGCAP